MSSDSLQELLAEIKAYPDGTDLLITAFYTAAHHYRRSTICAPFPSEVFPPPPGTKDKAFPALHRALAALPAVHSLLSGDEVLRNLPPQTLALLHWLLRNPARRRRFTLAPLGEMVRQLRQRSSSGAATVAAASDAGLNGTVDGGGGGGGSRSGWHLPSFAGHSSPAFVLRSQEGHAQEPFANSAVAYHGTHLENLHSIVQTGLQSGSGTRLQRTGANYGAGIYLSTNYDTAFSFCQPGDSWPRSRYGTKLRALLVCEVDLDNCSSERGAEAEASARAAANGAPASISSSTPAPATSPPSSGPASALPDTYLLVQRPDAVRVLYVLVFCDATRLSRPARVNWCTALVVLYAAFLFGKALLAALRQHRY